MNRRVAARKKSLTLPPFPAPGDTVGIVAPAGRVEQDLHLAAGVRILQDMGYRVALPANIDKRAGYLAGDDRSRAAAFHAMWRRPEVRAVMAARGGYGALRLAPLLDFDLLGKTPKLMVGFSDITVLLAALGKNCGLVSVHGPTVSTLAASDLASRQALARILAGDLENDLHLPDVQVLRGGKARGRLFCGNLTTLCHLIGSPWEPHLDDAVLVIEDQNEAAYRLDRLLTHLAASGRLDRLAGLVLGQFTLNGDDGSAAATVRERALALTRRIPVWANFPCGHGSANIPLPVGLSALMDSSARILHLGAGRH